MKKVYVLHLAYKSIISDMNFIYTSYIFEHRPTSSKEIFEKLNKSNPKLELEYKRGKVTSKTFPEIKITNRDITTFNKFCYLEERDLL